MESGVFGPTSWVFLGALVAGFGGLLYWLVRARLLVFRVIAAVLALAVGTLFGASLVNQSYEYYTSWGSLVDAMVGRGVSPYQPGLAPQALASGREAGNQTHDGAKHPPTDPPVATSTTAVPASITISPLGLRARPTAGTGKVVRVDLPGALSGIDRSGYVYLPPQYFDPAYADTSFPVLELLHGDPGEAAGWLYGLHLAEVMDHGIDAGLIGPMVVVMPSTFSGKHGQDCVDAPGGRLDDTYLSADVPADVTHDFRALPPGEHWGIGGLSDGGFCAANLALRHPGWYGAVASMDGFYSPAGDAGVLGRIFGKEGPGLRANDPSILAADTRYSLPRFWLMSGTGNSTDSAAMESFGGVLSAREPIASVIVRGGRHTTPAWRVALPSLLTWTWNTISGGPVGTERTTLSVSEPAPPATPRYSPSPTPTHSPTPTLTSTTSTPTASHPSV